MSQQQSLSQTAAPVADQVQQTAGQVVDKAQDTAAQLMEEARNQTESRLATQKDMAADSLHAVADALRDASGQLRDQSYTPVAGVADQAATQVDQISSYLRERDVRQLVSDVEAFARRQPGVFLGGTVALGVLAARFLKSSRRALDAQSSPYATQQRSYQDRALGAWPMESTQTPVSE